MVHMMVGHSSGAGMLRTMGLQNVDFGDEIKGKAEAVVDAVVEIGRSEDASDEEVM